MLLSIRFISDSRTETLQSYPVSKPNNKFLLFLFLEEDYQNEKTNRNQQNDQGKKNT